MASRRHQKDGSERRHALAEVDASRRQRRSSSKPDVTNVSKLRAMLNSRETVDLACELITAAGDAAIYEELLKGCEIVNGCIVPNHAFRAKQEWRTRALLRIIAHAPETAPVSPGRVLSLAISAEKVGSDGTPNQISQVRDSVLESLPEDVGNFPRLEKLCLDNTLIKELPDEIGNLVELRELVVRYRDPRYFHGLIGRRCPLHRIPATIGRLLKLETLDLSGNNIASLPDTIGDLRALKVLCLAGCPLTALPESIGRLTNLEALDLGGCPLESLPDSVGELQRLRVLVFKDYGWGHSMLTALPESLGDLVSLEQLDLSGTRVTSIPATVERLRSLKHLSLPSSIMHVPLELGLLSLEKLTLNNDYGGEVLSGIVLDLCRRAYAHVSRG